MVAFSNKENTDIHFICGYFDGDTRQIAQEYRRRFPTKNVLSESVQQFAQRLGRNISFLELKQNVQQNQTFTKRKLFLIILTKPLPPLKFEEYLFI